MNPIGNDHYYPVNNEMPRFNRGFSIAVVIILVVVIFIIAGLIRVMGQTTDYGNARVVYLAATDRAMESMASGYYQVPVQKDLVSLIGEDINAEATIQVVDENRDATIDFIVYTKNDLVTKYIPGDVVVTKK